MDFFFFGGGGGVQKNEYSFWYEDFVDNFWGHQKLGYILGSFLSILGSFLKVKVQNGNIYWVAKILNIFGGFLKFLIFVLV